MIRARSTRALASCRRLLGYAALLLVTMVPHITQAMPAAHPIIVLKSRVGPAEPKEAEGIASILDEQLEAEGLAAKPSTIARVLGARLPRPGILDTGLSAVDIIQPLELGYDLWTHGLFDDAVKKLRPALDKITRNPGLLVTDTKNLHATFKALVALALSQARLGQASESAETMADLVRMFQTRPVSRSEFGKPAEQFWRTIAKQVLAAGSGQLSITTGNRQAVVFVDGQIRGIERAAVADLVPGMHHVFVQVPSTAGLQYAVDVKPNENTELDISWDTDSSLTVAGSWIGFVFATEAERNKEALYAGELAKRWGGHQMVAVVSTVRIQGTTMLIGSLYAAGGKLVRSAVTNLDGDRVALMRSLARYLADGTVEIGVKVVGKDGDAVSSLAMVAPEHRSRPLAVTVGVAGVAAIAIGGAVYAVAEPTDAIYSNKQAASLYTMLGGSVLVGSGVYMWLRDSRTTNTRSAALVSVGAASMLAGAELILVDQDPEPALPTNVRDSRTVGVLVGAAGAVLTGVGIWLWSGPRSASASADMSRNRDHASLAPSITLGAGHAALGCSGVF